MDDININTTFNPHSNTEFYFDYKTVVYIYIITVQEYNCNKI